jgi:hypothetical protein
VPVEPFPASQKLIDDNALRIFGWLCPLAPELANLRADHPNDPQRMIATGQS